MIKNRIAKIAGVAAGAALAFGTLVPVAGAITASELQAQINALMAQLATLQGGTSTVSTGASITSDLTIGSTGAQVSALQSALVAQGHLVMPAGVAMGYFGSLTKSAVMKWQAANGVPSTGYFGPISRAKFNGSAGATGTVPGTTVGSGTTTGGTGITTPGVEGTLTASKNPNPASGVKAYEAGSKVNVLGIKLEAKTSDIKVERVKMQLSASTSGNSDQQFYTKIASRMYVMDGSTVLASTDLNSSTVVKEGSSYYITIAGFSYIVPKDSTKVLTIAIDPQASWDSAYDNDSWKVTVPVDGVRGVDGAGINQYSPTTSFYNEFTSAANVVDSAALSISLASNSPATSQVIADEGTSNNEKDGLDLAVFNFKGEKDDILVTDLVVDIVRGGTTNTATSTTAYIYDGSTLIGSATVAGTSLTAGSATFTDIDWKIPADTTKALTVKIDVDSAGAAATTFAADIGVTTAVATNVTSENSAGSSITETGSAQGKTISVRKVGPEISLVSKSITTSGVPQNNNAGVNRSTSTLTATFNIKIKAVGGDLLLGTVASGTPLFASTTNSLSAKSFQVYRNGSADSSVSSAATSTSYSIPNTCVSNGTNTCILAEGAEVTVPVTFQIIGRSWLSGDTLTVGSVYGVGLENIQWVGKDLTSATTTTFMSGEADWRTSDVSFP